MRRKEGKMNSKAKAKTMILIVLGIIFALSPIISNIFNVNGGNSNDGSEYSSGINFDSENLKVENEPNLKTAGYWNLTGSPIYINGNADWASKASGEDWCSGSGTWDNPYIIENVTIDGGNSSNCITIKNSNVFFRIENCTVYNSGSETWSAYAGIVLDHVNNGALLNNNCSNNYYGISLVWSNNNTIYGNTANDNTMSGIMLTYDCNNNTVSGNTANNNEHCGISVSWFSHNNTVTGNTANNNELGGGISVSQSSNNTISGNTANNNRYGINLYSSDNNTLSGNNANNNTDFGIDLYQSNNNTISGNTADNNFYNGIRLENSDYNTLSGNLMNFCGISLSGSLVEMASHSIDITNLVNNKPVYYYANEIALESSNFTYAGYAGQIILINCNNSKISGINISDGSGISLYYCVNNTLSGNNASNNDNYGIFLGYSNNNTLSGNTASNNNDYGIYLYYSNNNTLSGNTANNNGNGIFLAFSNNNTLSGNTASNNNYDGIALAFSNNNTLSGNTANNNSIGIDLYSSNNNNIILNCFNNTINALDDGLNNRWDNGIKGNYWSDYTGSDADGDGIGDIPYIISGSAGSQDNFPLMKCPISGGGIPIELIILISTISGGAVIGVATILLIRRKRKRIE